MINYRWENSIENISSELWDEIFDNQTIKSHAFFLAMERANLSEVKMLYLIIYQKKETLSIIPCFLYKMDISVLAPQKIKKIIMAGRNFFSNLLYADIFGVGSIAATCEEHIGIRKNITYEVECEVKKIIREQIKQRSKRLRTDFVMIKEIPEHKKVFLKSIFHDYFFYDSLPNSFIPIMEGTIPYPSALKRKQQKRYRKSRKAFDENFEWEIVQNFEEYASKIENYYLQVLNKSKNKFEKLNATFFKNIAELLDENSFVLIARDKKDQKICVFEVVIVEKSSLIPIYVGINYLEKYNIKDLYFNTIFRIIEEAEKLKKNYVVLGQTSYYPKILSGALIERLHLGFFSNKRIYKVLIKYLFKYLFAKTNTQKHTYRFSFADHILDEFQKKTSIIIDNK